MRKCIQKWPIFVLFGFEHLFHKTHKEIRGEKHSTSINMIFLSDSNKNLGSCSHIHASQLSMLIRLDYQSTVIIYLKITSGKLLISVDILLLDRKALQLYHIYPFPVYQNISGNHTRAVYILPGKHYIALTEDERKFFLTDKDYYDTCQKTIYHTICESTQSIHEIVTTTSCECPMLTRPSMKILQQCDVKINTKNSVFWKHIPSLKAWIFTTKNPEAISITCKKGKTEKGHITNSGILRLSAGCIARTEHTTLIGPK